MRLNVYSQELLPEAKLVEKAGKNGETFSAVMLMLASSPMLHQPPEHTGDDDDRSAISLWLPRSPDRRKALAATLEKMANLVRTAPPERQAQISIPFVVEVGGTYRTRGGGVETIVVKCSKDGHYYKMGYRFMGGYGCVHYTEDGRTCPDESIISPDDLIERIG